MLTDILECTICGLLTVGLYWIVFLLAGGAIPPATSLAIGLILFFLGSILLLLETVPGDNSPMT